MREPVTNTLHHRTVSVCSIAAISLLGVMLLSGTVYNLPGMKLTSTSFPVQLARHADRRQCRRSMRASHGFLCESEERWAERKKIFFDQQRQQVQPSKDRYFLPGKRQGGISAWFQSNYEPNFSCLEKRVGRAGDGGKWLCAPHRIRSISRERKKKCVVFSFGSNNDYSFEKSILEDLPDCDVHTFDHTISPRNVPENVHFHRWGLGANDGGKLKSLHTIMRNLNLTSNHSLEVLKVDCEGAEWDIFVGDRNGTTKGLLARNDFPFTRQILIELHPVDLPRTRKFFQLMDDNGYVITHKEPNTLQGGMLTEYAFMKVNMKV